MWTNMSNLNCTFYAINFLTGIRQQLHVLCSAYPFAICLPINVIIATCPITKYCIVYSGIKKIPEIGIELLTFIHVLYMCIWCYSLGILTYKFTCTCVLFIGIFINIKQVSLKYYFLTWLTWLDFYETIQ